MDYLIFRGEQLHLIRNAQIRPIRLIPLATRKEKEFVKQQILSCKNIRTVFRTDNTKKCRTLKLSGTNQT